MDEALGAAVAGLCICRFCEVAADAETCWARGILVCENVADAETAGFGTRTAPLDTRFNLPAPYGPAVAGRCIELSLAGDLFSLFTQAGAGRCIMVFTIKLLDPGSTPPLQK